jgi:fumarate hydratase class II
MSQEPGKLYGPSTDLAMENFPISGWRMPPAFLRALALVKEHAAVVNGELGVIPRTHAQAIAEVAAAIKGGQHLDQFPVDVFQTGSGTSTNMNMNEVIATLANQRARQKLTVHPNDHVNRSQSSNDVIPTALQISCALVVVDDLLPALTELREVCLQKAKEFHPIIKTSRTHLMDAVPVRLGDEFRSYARLLEGAILRVQEVTKLLVILPLGGTAAGTGLNAPAGFARKVISRIARETMLPLEEASDHIAVQSCPMALQALSSALKEVAVVLTKMAQDIRWMASGPIAGLSELRLPELQPGSSIMPGKVNPVLCESVLQVAAWVIGADATVTICTTQGSNFELHTCFPVLAAKLLSSLELLANVSQVFAERCVLGIKANERVMADLLAENSMLATALAPHIGYEAAAEIAREAVRTSASILEVAARRTKISKEKLRKLLDPKRMV